MSTDPKAPVTIEQLLRLKRAERPSPEFWTQFESELRAKQLAAIVEKRPWWTAWPRAGLALRRLQLPLGATAAVAVAWLGVHEYSSPRAAAPDFAPPAAVSDAMAAASAPSAAAEPALAAAAESAVPSPATEVAATRTDAPAVPAVSPAESTAVADTAVAEAQAVEQAAPSSDRVIGANFAAAAVSASAMAGPAISRGLLGLTQDYEARLLPSRSRVSEPLAQMTSPSEERRSRLLAATFPVVEASAAVTSRSSERLLNNLSDDRLVESIQRYGVDANRVSFKF